MDKVDITSESAQEFLKFATARLEYIAATQQATMEKKAFLGARAAAASNGARGAAWRAVMEWLLGRSAPKALSPGKSILTQPGRSLKNFIVSNPKTVTGTASTLAAAAPISTYFLGRSNGVDAGTEQTLQAVEPYMKALFEAQQKNQNLGNRLLNVFNSKTVTPDIPGRASQA